MADAAYDAIVIGGGSKGMVLGMYLAKYGGLKVGMFEDRHELGGGCESIENSAPGFIANTHSFFHAPKLYHGLTEEDFPEYVEYGGVNLAAPVMGVVSLFGEDDTATGTFTVTNDPTQQKTAEIMGRFSKRDGEFWLKFWGIYERYIRDAVLEYLSTPPDPLGAPEAIFEKMMKNPEVPEVIDPQFMSMTPRQVFEVLFEAAENQILFQRAMYSSGFSMEERGMGLLAATTGMGMWADMMGWMKGGTHSFAHAAQRVFRENSGEYFTSSEVEKLIIENDTAKGIKLKDGTEIEARKLVVSTLSPHQVIFDLIGKERVSSHICRKVNVLVRDISLIHWYWFALHELPHYKAGDVMGLPIETAFWLNPASRDPRRLTREEMRRRFLQESPPYPDEPLNLAVIGGNFSEVDKTQSPEEKYTLLIEQYDVPAFVHEEEWWLKQHEVIARGMIDELHKYAPNITWDTVIGWAPSSPYTICRLKNMAPYGNWYIIDWTANQVGSNRPIPELAGYKVPGIKGFYCTGSGWHGSIGAADQSGYNCYKVIAKDFDLKKPWEEKGRPY